MLRPLTFLLFSTAFFCSTLAWAQTPPPGPPFDSAKHPNPIITFVESKDFKPAALDQVRKDSGIELLGISQEEGKRQSIEIASGRFVKNMSILGIRTDVTFYPVVRQKFALTGDAELVVYSFRFPKVALPPDFTRIVLNEAAVERKKKPAEMRFGGAKPEQLEIRGARALLFEMDGRITVYWQEDGIGHTVSAAMDRKKLFEVIENLL